MFKGIFAIGLLCTTLTAHATHIECEADKLNGHDVTVHMTGNILRDDMKNMSLTVDNEVIRHAKLITGKEYNGLKYKGMLRFNFEDSNVKAAKGNIWTDASIELLVPQDFEIKGYFHSVLSVVAPDGGKSNPLKCRVEL